MFYCSDKLLKYRAWRLWLSFCLIHKKNILNIDFSADNYLLIVYNIAIIIKQGGYMPWQI